jgi:hypothetical protein
MVHTDENSSKIDNQVLTNSLELMENVNMQTAPEDADLTRPKSSKVNNSIEILVNFRSILIQTKIFKQDGSFDRRRS